MPKPATSSSSQKPVTKKSSARALEHELNGQRKSLKLTNGQRLTLKRSTG